MRLRGLVIAGIAVLLLVGGGSYWMLRRAVDRTRWNYSRDYLEMAAKAVEKFRDQGGCYPTAAEFAQPASLAYPSDDVPSDMWGRPFVYESRSCDTFTLRWLGRDGQPGGSDLDSDMTITEASEGRASSAP